MAGNGKGIYDYKSNSNIVLQQERSRGWRNQPTGEVERLTADDIGKMGTSMRRVEPKRTRQESAEKSLTKRLKSTMDDSLSIFSGGKSRQKTAADTGTSYVPKSKETSVAYESLLANLQHIMGDVQPDTLRSAAEELLIIVRNRELNSNMQRIEVIQLLGAINDDQFHIFVSLGQRLDDFSTSNVQEIDYDFESSENANGIEQAVPVVLDDEDDERSEGSENAEEHEDEVDPNETNDWNASVPESFENVVAEDHLKLEETRSKGDSVTFISATAIDAFWIQRELGKYFDDANESQSKAAEVLRILGTGDDRICENKLVLLLNFERFSLIRLLLKNRRKIWYCTRLNQAQNADDRNLIEFEMSADTTSGGGSDILAEIRNGSGLQESVQMSDTQGMSSSTVRPEVATNNKGVRPSRTLDLKSLKFDDGGHVLTNRKCELPKDSWRKQEKSYEEVHVPPPKSKPMDMPLVLIAELPPWMQPAFAGMESLNRIQSKIYPAAVQAPAQNGDEIITPSNLLISAPTGAGKTNVAVLAIMNEVGRFLRPGTDWSSGQPSDIDRPKLKQNLKIVYIAPMKALVQEVVANFTFRLTEKFGLNVRELSGDQQLSRLEIMDTQIIVTTPEKWDVVTRKAGERAYTQLVRLVIVDEIHLLHDTRGAVLECLIARLLRKIEETQEPVRIVGISATLPNFEDVATFLRVQEDQGLFFFDNSFRPVRLQQQYIGVTEKKAVKRMEVTNEICYDKVAERAGKSQILVFVHSRKETARTAKAIRDMAIEKQTIGDFIKDDRGTREILLSESEKSVQNADLKDLLPHSFAIHHAGMTRSDRKLVEDLFADRHIQVLVSTATLAWGVNLPAHTVIIKGTQVYNPELGRWTELSQLDVLQMLGRAGRPQFDTEGEGIVVTTHEELQFYLSLMNQQLPIESQLIAKLPDHLNAEIVSGTVQNIQDASKWLGYTYLYVRMLKNPGVYGLSSDDLERDPLLAVRRVDLAHSAAILLDKAQLIHYDRRTGSLHPTALGRVASHFYVTFESMSKFNELLKPSMSDIEILRVFSLSGEFANIAVRAEEKLELGKLLERVPIPVRESLDDPSAKVNVLLQAYISGLHLEGFAMSCDLVYVHQSAGRIMRALFEVCLHRGWASLARKCLELCMMIDKRMWYSQCPLRQYGPNVVEEPIMRALERKNIRWDRYFHMSTQDLGELVRNPRAGKTLHRLIHCFPRFELAAHVQPITRSTIRIELTLTPDFEFVEEHHGQALQFYVMVEDVDGEVILHHELFTLKKRFAEEEHIISFTVPLSEPTPPQYFVHVIGDKWLHAHMELPISFQNLLLPEKFSPHTELLDLQPMPTSVFNGKQSKGLFPRSWKFFNAIQTQTFPSLYQSDENVLVAASSGRGKSTCAEFAILRAFESDPEARIVYVCCEEEVCFGKHSDWSSRFGMTMGKSVGMLTGDSISDLRILNECHITISTAEHWDRLSRGWKQKSRKAVHELALFLVDELHLIGGRKGPVLEVVVSRMRYICAQLDKKFESLPFVVVGKWIRFGWMAWMQGKSHV